MLVLSRKKNESIIIDGCITVTIVEIRGDKVRLGISAPADVAVHRREVFEAIQRQIEKGHEQRTQENQDDERRDASGGTCVAEHDGEQDSDQGPLDTTGTV